MGIVVGKRRVAISRSLVEEARVMLKIANKSSFAVGQSLRGADSSQLYANLIP
jgi:hypothetical protein